jgi:two-component system, NarL family, sensor kinase
VDILRQSAQLQDLSWRLLRTQDEERRYVARELHDSAGQTLALLGMSLSQHIREAERSSPALRKSSEEVEKLVRQLQNDIRTTSYLLHPPLLDEAGLISALTWYVDGLRARSSLEIDLTISEPFGRLPRELELVIFRLVQECLTNIHRHSGSKTASIRIRKEKETVLVEVQDQGRGIPPEKFANVQAQGSGVGIRGMRERVLQFQGVLDINSSSSGTTVSAVMHIPETAVPREESGSVKIAI